MQRITQDRRQSRFRWMINMILLICAGVLFSSTFMLFRTNNRIFQKHLPLVQTVNNIKIHMLEAHLWFEEAVSGDATVMIEDIQDLLDESDQDVQALLDGGVTCFGKIDTVQYPILRDDFKQIQLRLGESRQIVEERWKNISTSGVGSPIDQQYDTLLGELLADVNKACDDANAIIARESKVYKHSDNVLLGTTSAILLAVSVLINYLLSYQYKSNQKLFSINQQLEANEQQLRAANQQLQASEQQLQAANQQLQASEMELQAANQQLRASEQQLRATNQQLTANEIELKQLARFPSENPSPVLRILDDGTISYYNRASKPLLDAWQCGHTDKLSEPWLDIVKQTLDSGEPTQIEVDCKDWIFLVTFSPIVDMNYVNLYAIDVTQRKQAEEKTTGLANILETSLNEIYIFDAETLRFIQVNDGARKNIGYTMDELRGLTPLDIKPEFTADRFATLVEPLRTGEEKIITFETIHRSKDGSAYPVEVHLQLSFLECRKVFTAVILDITKRKWAEESLKSSLSMLTAALESTADGILIVDGRGKIEQWNQKFAEMWQIPDEIISGQDDNAAIEHVLSQLTDPEQFVAKVRALYAQPDASSFDQLEFKDGRVFERYSQPQKIGDTIVGRVWSFRDVTNRKKAEQQQERLMRKLKSKNEELQSIVYISSHDLRSPLVNINGFSDLLTRHINRLKSLVKNGTEESRSEVTELLEEHIPEDIEFIAHGTKKMELLINGLLQVSMVGTAAGDSIELDMNGLIDTIIDNVAYKAKQTDAVITRDNLSPCYGDSVQINQVFSNLIDNALKYHDPARKTHVHISCTHQNSDTVYCVQDNGIGIAHDQHEKVFNLFYRFDPGHLAEGEGLGLTIIRRILDHHSGRVWIESIPGEGSKFFISLPKKEAI